MQENQFNYRQQLIEMYHLLDEAAVDFYSLGFDIGLKKEWQDFEATLESGEGIPIDIEYLKAINHPAIPSIITLVEILWEARDSVETLNNLSNEELALQMEAPAEPPAEPLSEGEIALLSNLYVDADKLHIFDDLGGIYTALWELAFTREAPGEVYFDFSRKYFEGGLELTTEDPNVQLVLEALNKVLLINCELEEMLDS
mgnify:CR=1 FL=1